LGAVAVLAAAAGCGGGDSTSATSPELTKAQFVKQATAICQKTAEEKQSRLEAAIKGERGRGLFAASNAELEKLASKVVLPLYGEALSRLGDLNPPAKDKARVGRILHGYEAAMKEAEADPSTGFENNPFAKPDEAAAAYGFGCSL
jgi:hypothetical protein